MFKPRPSPFLAEFTHTQLRSAHTRARTDCVNGEGHAIPIYPSLVPSRPTNTGKGRLVTIELIPWSCACASGYIINTCSGRRAYHEYSAWGFPGPAKTACPALLRYRAPSSLPRPESVSCSLSFARTVALTKVCDKLCAPEIWDTSPESTLIGQQDFGVEDQGMFQSYQTSLPVWVGRLGTRLNIPRAVGHAT